MDESIRGTGFGKHIMTYVEEYTRERGIHQITLETADAQAPWFYEKIGYQKYGSIPGFIKGRDGTYMGYNSYVKKL